MNQVTITFRAPLLSKGLMNWDYYHYGTSTTGNPMLDLTGSQNYPDVPWTNWGLTTFNSQEITGGQLENRPGWGSLGNNYGAVVSGWVTPTVSGSYRFFLHSDDASELYLSTSADPVASPPALIAYDLTCCHGFTEPTNDPPVTYISGPISLQANTPYFIYARHTEGGCQDYVRVAWRREGDSTPAASLTPIPGQYLSSYAPSPLRLTAAPARSSTLLRMARQRAGQWTEILSGR